MSNKIKVFKIKAVTASPFYTGEVREEEKRASRVNFPVRKTATGRVIVPFKGALRSSLEQLLRANGEQVCDTGQPKARPCGRCVLCDLFGSMREKARATVSFLISEQDKSQIVREATHIKINRENGSVSDTFKGEEVIEGTVFNGVILVENPKPKDEELIKAAIKYLEAAGVGGWKSRGYGKMKFEIEVEEAEKSKFLRN